MRKMTLLLLMMASTLGINAQTDDEYLMEVGGGVGLMGYLGDYNGSLTRGLQPMVTLMMRRNMNAYMAFRLAVSMGKLKGDERNAGTYYPLMGGTAYAFNRSVTDVGLTYEYNFWPYGTGNDYYGAKRLILSSSSEWAERMSVGRRKSLRRMFPLVSALNIK